MIDQLAEFERQKYVAVWDQKWYRDYSPGMDTAPRALQFFEPLATGDSLTDYGCGTGRAALWFQQQGLAVTGIDIAANAIDEKPSAHIQFRVECLWSLSDQVVSTHAYCTDVMEHIPEDQVEAVLAAIFSRTASKAVFRIAHFASSQPELHQTVRSPQWWTMRLIHVGRQFDFNLVRQEAEKRNDSTTYYLRKELNGKA